MAPDTPGRRPTQVAVLGRVLKSEAGEKRGKWSGSRGFGSSNEAINPSHTRERVTMTRAITILGLGAATVLTSAASATVTGLSSEFVGTVSGRDIWNVYVLSDGPSASGQHDVLLNMIGHQVVSGSMAHVKHNDNYVDGAGAHSGHWNATYTSAPSFINLDHWRDSYVTITGTVGSQASTTLDPSFGTGIATGTGEIPAAAGWYTANPAVDILITGGKIKIMQIAVTATANQAFEYTGKMHVGYKLQGTASPLYGMNMTYTIGTPAPGALALLGAAGVFTRRRRSGCGGIQG